MTSCSARRRETAALAARSRSSKQTSPDDKRHVERRPHAHAPGRSQAFFQPPREAASALGDPLPSDHVRAGRAPPTMPSGARTSGSRRGQQRSGRPVRGVFAVHPRLVCPAVEARYRSGWSRRQALDRPQSSPVPRGPNSHLWQPGREHVAAELGRRRLLDAEAVHAVDAQQHALDALAGPGSPRAQRRRCRGAAASRPCEEWTHVTATHTGSIGVSARADRGNRRARVTPSPGRRRGGRSGSRRRSSSPPPRSDTWVA